MIIPTLILLISAGSIVAAALSRNTEMLMGALAMIMIFGGFYICAVAYNMFGEVCTRSKV
jgi:hypothetical protein